MMRYVEVCDLQSRLGISRQTAYRWAWRGDIPSVKIGGRRLIPLEALEARLEKGVELAAERGLDDPATVGDRGRVE